MKILINALSGIGDALIFTPALKLLKEEMPDAQVDALVMFGGVKDIYERNPYIDNVFFFEFIKEGPLKSLNYILNLRGKYDASLNVYPSNRKEYNVINTLIGAKKRAGVNYLRKDFQNLGWLNNVTIKENDRLHNAQTNIKLVEKLICKKFNSEPAFEFYLNKNDKAAGEKFLQENNISKDDVVIGFHPGTAVLKNHIKRRWEPEKFAELGRRLIEKEKAKILIFGGPDEIELKENIRKQINSANAFSVTKLNLPESAALMKRCNVFVSNDSSLMHVASAMQLKVVAIIGPTNPVYIHPWKTEHKIVTLNLECAPCFIYSPRPLICFRDDVKFKCIKELTVDMVYEAVQPMR
ncbi:MAG TPA: glycosyltransferase family 9 protein [Ignavibacteriaceae bacterium]|nr:glycosyltransferase family 9 protein [Ignavibacteriaceae bacterium]